MATVYLAQDIRHARQVAIKVLRPEIAASLGAERFLREITTTANLHHPHILPLYDSGEADGCLYYLMPYVEGESLRDRLRRERQLPLEDTLQIVREVADGIPGPATAARPAASAPSSAISSGCRSSGNASTGRTWPTGSFSAMPPDS